MTIDREDVRVEPLLRLEGMHKRYGGVHALRGADLAIGSPGVVHGLLGENGSGKSTLLGVLSGQVCADRGAMFLEGREVRFANPLDAIRAGIAMVSQETALAAHLSVAENIFLGGRMARGRRGINWAETRRRAASYLGRLELDVDPITPVRLLRPDQQQVVEIARALSLNARILILDEPTSSLTDDQVQALFAVIGRLKQQGVSFVFVSHRINEMNELADELTVLRDGVTAAAGPMTTFDTDRIVHAMVGEATQSTSSVRRPRPDVAGAPLLEVRDLRVADAVRGVSLTVRRGEIVGLAGLTGAGRSELLDAIFGDRPIAAGECVVAGTVHTSMRPLTSIEAGVGYLPADRKVRGLVLKRTIRENVLMARTCRRSRLRMTERDDGGVVARIVRTLRIRASSAQATTSTLSGGNQQKVALGKWLANDPQLMLLDEPTRGVDISAKAEIHQHLRDMADAGIGMLVSSSENPELLTICDRVLVMQRGRIFAEVAADQASEALLTRYAGGHV